MVKNVDRKNFLIKSLISLTKDCLNLVTLDKGVNRTQMSSIIGTINLKIKKEDLFVFYMFSLPPF